MSSCPQEAPASDKDESVVRGGNGQPTSSTEVLEKDVLKRIDRILMPMLFVTYVLQFMDKASLSNATIMGIIKDTDLVGQQLSWLSSVFYFGYLAVNLPVSVLLVKCPLGKTMAITVAIWGVILCCHAAGQNFGGLCAARILLGVFEGAVSPGFALITSLWYKPSEHAARHSVWFAGNPIGTILGSLIAYGCSYVSRDPLEPWRWLFIIMGAVTALWGLYLLPAFPDTPSSAWFLTQEQRQAADHRSQSHQRSFKTYKWVPGQFYEAFRDGKTWFMVLIMTISSLGNGVTSNFHSLITKGLGFDTRTTLLLNLPYAAFQFIVVIVSSIIANRVRRSRLILVAIGTLFSLAGALLIRQLPTSSKGGRFVGVILLTSWTNVFPLLLSLSSSNTGGTTKKATVNAIFFVGYCAGNIAGPQLFIVDEAPTYQTGFTGLLIIYCLVIVISIVFRFYLDYLNKHRDKEQGRFIDPEPRDSPQALGLEQPSRPIDETDFQNRDYRYCM